MRADLLALTPDDLAVLSNRGTVKRVQRELEEPSITVQMSECDDGIVQAIWAEGVICTLPPDVPLAECICTCPALGVCRHLVQTVLYYQQWTAAQNPTIPITATPWNPGDISDETLSRHYRKVELVKLRKQFESTQVIELVCGIKPLARFHTLPVVVRFLVPDDPHYSVCNCAETAPCSHVALAIWAFRLLPDNAVSGIVETGQQTQVVPTETLDEIHIVLSDLLELGVSGASEVSVRRLSTLIRRCRDDGLIWPADILNELAEEFNRYQNQDARFSALYVADLIGELILRYRAIRHSSGAVPSLFVRGSQQDHVTEVGTARLAGLGCQAVTRHGVTQLSAYFVDTDSGGIVAMQRQFVDPRPGDSQVPAAYSELSRVRVFKDSGLDTIGTRQLLIKGGKRTANAVFVPNRATASVMPSAFNWETLRPPLLADSFSESRARRAMQPPTCLSPRRVGEDLAVFSIAAVGKIAFDSLNQALMAVLHDLNGEEAMLIFPYSSRSSEGMDTLMWWLEHHADGLRFVSGATRYHGARLEITPIALIFEVDGTRYMVQPWVDHRTDSAKTDMQMPSDRAASPDMLRNYLDQVRSLLAELFLNGLRRVDDRVVEQWNLAVQQGNALGLVRLMEPIEALAAIWSQRQHHLDWNWRTAVNQVLEVATILRFAEDIT